MVDERGAKGQMWHQKEKKNHKKMPALMLGKKQHI
jgi:hypothetical protein